MVPLNSVTQGDCLEVMSHIPDGSIDLILADLPYATTRNVWDSLIPLELLWAHYKRLLKSNGVAILTASQPFTSALVMSNPKWFKHEWVWIKNRGSNFANTVREPMKEHEGVLVFSPGKWTYNRQMQERTGAGGDRVKHGFNHRTKTENYGGFKGKEGVQLPELRVPSSWQKFNTEVGLHPTQKPTALFEYLIKTYTNEGETVLDNVAGSGTTAIAAIRTNRNYILIEKEEAYVDVIRTRIDKELAQTRMFAQAAD